MRGIDVCCSGNPYRVTIGAGALTALADELNRLGFDDTVIVVTDATVAELFGEGLERHLAESRFSPHLIVIPPGEDQKCLEMAGVLYGRLNELGAERSTPLVAFGGGVVGDLTGFVAATYFRGLPLVQVPTTLLAQVDSSIGGKVAVNHGTLKNNVGAFHQPVAVITDTSLLTHLPEREFRNGLAEVIKSAMIRDETFFRYLESQMECVTARDSEVLERIVARTVEIKASVVAEDEKDTGLRNILNFGHTVGHGIESATSFSLCHGEAVSIGMIAATQIAIAMNMVSMEVFDRLKSLLQRAGLPVAIPDFVDLGAVLDAMSRDKKMAKGRLRFILPVRTGVVEIRGDVSMDLLRRTLESCYAAA